MSLVFPEDYGKAESSKFQKTNDVPMMGFQALKISEKQTIFFIFKNYNSFKIESILLINFNQSAVIASLGNVILE